MQTLHTWIVYLRKKKFPPAKKQFSQVIQYGDKSESGTEIWTVDCRQIFAGWEIQTTGNLQKNLLCGEISNVLVLKIYLQMG